MPFCLVLPRITVNLCVNFHIFDLKWDLSFCQYHTAEEQRTKERQYYIENYLRTQITEIHKEVFSDKILSYKCNQEYLTI